MRAGWCHSKVMYTLSYLKGCGTGDDPGDWRKANNVPIFSTALTPEGKKIWKEKKEKEKAEGLFAVQETSNLLLNWIWEDHGQSPPETHFWACEG